MEMIKNFDFGRGVRATIYCRFRDTRNGFAHDCTIPALGLRATCHYLNRTWESFQFESVIREAFDKYVRRTHKVRNAPKVYDREYGKLTKRLTAWHGKGKMKFVREPDDIFAFAA